MIQFSMFDVLRALDLTDRMQQARKDGSLLSVVLPNGKKLGDCTMDDLRETEE